MLASAKLEMLLALANRSKRSAAKQKDRNREALWQPLGSIA